MTLGAALAGSAVVGQIPARAEDASPPNDPPWSQMLGPGVVAAPRPAVRERQGRDPPQRALADAASRIVGELFAVAGPARHHHRQRPVFRALPRRTHQRRSGAAPADDPRAGRAAAALDHGGHRAVSRRCRASTSSSARPTAAWSGAPPSSTRCSSPTAWSSCAEWTGVRLSTLLEEVGLKTEAKWAMVEGADAAHMNRSLPIEKCLDDCLVVYGQNGEALRPEQGFPLRLRRSGLAGQREHQMAAPHRDRRASRGSRARRHRNIPS